MLRVQSDVEGTAILRVQSDVKGTEWC